MHRDNIVEFYRLASWNHGEMHLLLSIPLVDFQKAFSFILYAITVMILKLFFRYQSIIRNWKRHETLNFTQL